MFNIYFMMKIESNWIISKSGSRKKDFVEWKDDINCLIIVICRIVDLYYLLEKVIRIFFIGYIFFILC